MKFLKLVVAWSFFFSLLCLWILHFIRNDEVSKISSDIKEIRATVAQQQQERHLFDTNVDTLWRLESSDSAVIYRKDRAHKIVTLYYSK